MRRLIAFTRTTDKPTASCGGDHERAVNAAAAAHSSQ
jgi:hypothetical protein